MSAQEYLCPVRKLKLSLKHAVGERCYLGAKDNSCNAQGKLCDILEAHELSQSQAKCTTEDSDSFLNPNLKKY